MDGRLLRIVSLPEGEAIVFEKDGRLYTEHPTLGLLQMTSCGWTRSWVR